MHMVKTMCIDVCDRSAKLADLEALENIILI